MPAACSARTILLNSRTASVGVAAAAYRTFGREERQRVVAPVVRQAALDQVPVVAWWCTGISSTAVTPSFSRC